MSGGDKYNNRRPIYDDIDADSDERYEIMGKLNESYRNEFKKEIKDEIRRELLEVSIPKISEMVMKNYNELRNALQMEIKKEIKEELKQELLEELQEPSSNDNEDISSSNSEQESDTSRKRQLDDDEGSSSSSDQGSLPEKKCKGEHPIELLNAGKIPEGIYGKTIYDAEGYLWDPNDEDYARIICLKSGYPRIMGMKGGYYFRPFIVNGHMIAIGGRYDPKRINVILNDGLIVKTCYHHGIQYSTYIG